MPVPAAVWAILLCLHPLIAPIVVLSVDKLSSKTKGKRFAVLGVRQVGKSHLIEFLVNGTIPKGYKKTLTAVKTPKKKINLRELHLQLKESRDLPGDDSSRAEWKSLVEESDFVLYLLRADHVLANNADVEKRVKSDIRFIAEWIEQNNTPKCDRKLFVVATHCDMSAYYQSTYSTDMAGFLDMFKKLPVIRELVIRGGGLKKVRVIAGSMRTEQETEVLAYQILREVVVS